MISISKKFFNLQFFKWWFLNLFPENVGNGEGEEIPSACADFENAGYRFLIFLKENGLALNWFDSFRNQISLTQIFQHKMMPAQLSIFY